MRLILVTLLALMPGVAWSYSYTETSRTDTFGYRHSTTRDDNGKVIRCVSYKTTMGQRIKRCS